MRSIKVSTETLELLQVTAHMHLQNNFIALAPNQAYCDFYVLKI